MSPLLGYLYFFNDTAPTEIYPYRHTLSLHYPLPISAEQILVSRLLGRSGGCAGAGRVGQPVSPSARGLAEVEVDEAVDDDPRSAGHPDRRGGHADRKSTRLNSSH